MNTRAGNKPKHMKLPFPVRQGSRLPSKLFYAAYCIWLPLMILNSSAFAKYLAGGIYSIGRIVCTGLLVFAILSDFIITTRHTLGIVLAILISVSALQSADTVLIDSILLIFCARKEDFEKIAKLSLYIISALLLVIILSSFAGIIPNYSGWSGGRQRYYLGFRYALYPANYMFMVSCISMYLLNTQVRMRHVLLLMFFNYFIFYFTTSRLSFYLACFIIIASYVLAVVQNRFFEYGIPRIPIVGIILASSFSVMLVISFAIAFSYSYSNQFLVGLDDVSFLGGRISISNNALHTYGFNFFGREMHFAGAAVPANGIPVTHSTNYNYIDNLFIKATINYGVIFMSIFLLIVTAIMWRNYWEGNSFVVLILIAISLHCCIDNAMLHIYYNTFLFLTGELMTRPSYASSSYHKQLTRGFFSLFFLMLVIFMLIIFCTI